MSSLASTPIFKILAALCVGLALAAAAATPTAALFRAHHAHGGHAARVAQNMPTYAVVIDVAANVGG